MRVIFAICFLMIPLVIPLASLAQDRLVRLYAPAELVETGLFKYAMPRFSLKTQVKVTLVDQRDGADMVIGPDGTPLFEGLGVVWAASTTETPHTKKLMDWMRSDVGQRTIFGFAPEGGPALFSAPRIKEATVAPATIGDDAVLGKQVSRDKCARCHAVDEQTRMSTIGSTPSFFVLRTFEDWEYRFSIFYVLAPHSAFTQIKDVTEPFAINRPSPIVPIELSMGEVEAILAYMAVLSPADLGAPIQAQ